MKKSAIKFEYDRSVDAAYLRLAAGKVVGSEEVQPGLIVDRGARGQILGVELLRFAARFGSQTKMKASNGRTRLRKSA